MSEFLNNPEAREQSLILELEKRKDEALEEAREKYGSYTPDDPKLFFEEDSFVGYESQKPFKQFAEDITKLPFHSGDHSQHITDRTERMINAINEKFPGTISQVEQAALLAAAAHHDIVQEYTLSDDRTARNAKGGHNEKESTKRAIEGVTDKRLATMMKEGIHSTQPDAFLFTEGTITQKMDSWDRGADSWKAKLIALSDIGAAGMNAKRFIVEGDAFALESNPSILATFKAYSSGAELKDEAKVAVAEAIKDNDAVQIKWAKGRKKLTHESFDGTGFSLAEFKPDELAYPAEKNQFPTEVQEVLAELFTDFDESIRICEERQKQRENMSFEELAEHFGFGRAA